MPYKIRDNMEMADRASIAMFRKMTPRQRLRTADGMWDCARRTILARVCHEHPEWTKVQVNTEAARRLSHGSISTP